MSPCRRTPDVDGQDEEVGLGRARRGAAMEIVPAILLRPVLLVGSYAIGG